MGSFSETYNDLLHIIAALLFGWRGEKTINQYACSRRLVAEEPTRVSQHVHFRAW